MRVTYSFSRASGRERIETAMRGSCFLPGADSLPVFGSGADWHSSPEGHWKKLWRRLFSGLRVGSGLKPEDPLVYRRWTLSPGLRAGSGSKLSSEAPTLNLRLSPGLRVGSGLKQVPSARAFVSGPLSLPVFGPGAD